MKIKPRRKAVSKGNIT